MKIPVITITKLQNFCLPFCLVVVVFAVSVFCIFSVMDFFKCNYVEKDIEAKERRKEKTHTNIAKITCIRSRKINNNKAKAT